MRTEQEMMDLIIEFAERDDRVRAVIMNGSRANPNAPKDVFQDYDIVYMVTDVDSFVADAGWIDVFGERMILQLPDMMTTPPRQRSGRFTYLMQFVDGTRIDLTLVLLAEAEACCKEDKLTVALLDKDDCLPKLDPPTDEDYRVQPPSAKLFGNCCNEFWWVAPYVAKGLCRNEILYAKKHLDNYVRGELLKMLEWQAGMDTEFSLSVGKCHKYLERYLAKETWQALLSTFADGSYEATWDALFAACDLFRTSAKAVAAHFGYEYPEDDDARVTEHLKRVRGEYA